MTHKILHLIALLSTLTLTACGAPTKDVAPDVTPGYEGVEDEGFFIQPVEAKHLAGGQARQEVAYAGDESPGTIVVDTFSRRLYYVMEGGRAMQYAIAVGREGLSFRGAGVIGRMETWPSWQPTANMVRTRPDLYAEYAGGLPGGLENPLGARAMYLYRGGRDSMFRIHGTIQNATIGHATSAGCIRLFNQDAIDLYNRVGNGTRVKVRSAAESLELDGAFIDNAYGRAVPDTPENIAARETDALQIVKDDARRLEEEALAAEQAAKLAAKADKKRLSACKRSGIDALDCPALPDMTASDTAENSAG